MRIYESIQKKLLREEVIEHFRYKKNSYVKKRLQEISINSISSSMDKSMAFYWLNLCLNFIFIFIAFKVLDIRNIFYITGFFIISLSFSTNVVNPFTKYIYNFLFQKSVKKEKLKLIEIEYKKKGLDSEDALFLSNFLKREELEYLLTEIKKSSCLELINIDNLEFLRDQFVRNRNEKSSLNSFLDSVYEEKQKYK